MKFISKIKLPQKSIFGFKILSSLQSSISCYGLFLFGKILNPFFGFSQTQTIAAALFNIVLNISLLILIMNIISKRKEMPKLNFIFFNLLLFLYLPISIDELFKNIKVLLFF